MLGPRSWSDHRTVVLLLRRTCRAFASGFRTFRGTQLNLWQHMPCQFTQHQTPELCIYLIVARGASKQQQQLCWGRTTGNWRVNCLVDIWAKDESGRKVNVWIRIKVAINISHNNPKLWSRDKESSLNTFRSIPSPHSGIGHPLPLGDSSEEELTEMQFRLVEFFAQLWIDEGNELIFDKKLLRN